MLCELGSFLTRVLQLGPTNGPFDFQYVVDELFSLCGGRAIFTSSPMHRYFCDIHGARAHYANRPEASGRNYGGVQLGMKTTDFFL